MTPQKQNLFSAIPATLQNELFHTLTESDTIRIERIVSDGHATPKGEWYDQEQDEWVLLVSGGATLLFDDNTPAIALYPGDHIMIPARCRHRVEWTDSEQKTIWLAVHFDSNKTLIQSPPRDGQT